MSERSLLDPFGLWAAMVRQVETLGSQATETHLKTAEFSALMNKALAGSMTARKALRDGMKRYLEVMNLPSRDDVAALGEQLRALEDRLLAMSDVLARLDPGGAATGRAATPHPPRTRKPPPEPVAEGAGAGTAPAAAAAAGPAAAPTTPPRPPRQARAAKTAGVAKKTGAARKAGAPRRP